MTTAKNDVFIGFYWVITWKSLFSEGVINFWWAGNKHLVGGGGGGRQGYWGEFFKVGGGINKFLVGEGGTQFFASIIYSVSNYIVLNIYMTFHCLTFVSHHPSYDFFNSPLSKLMATTECTPYLKTNNPPSFPTKKQSPPPPHWNVKPPSRKWFLEKKLLMVDWLWWLVVLDTRFNNSEFGDVYGNIETIADHFSTILNGHDLDYLQVSSLFHLKITVRVTKSLDQDCGLFYLRLPIIFLYIHSPLLLENKNLLRFLFSPAS